MRRRYNKRSTIPIQNLDSFLDILTNTVGVLMFVGLFISVVAVQSATIVRTPLVSSTDNKPRFFEVNGNKVTYLDQEKAQLELSNFSKSLPDCLKPELPTDNLDIYSYNYDYYIQQIQEHQKCVVDKTEQIKDFRVQIPHYEVRVNIDSSLGIVYEPLAANTGESARELSQANSKFQSIIKNLNPQTDYLAFIVRPDSFAAFRQAREIAWKQGFDVGWEPMKSDTLIEFSSGGRTIGVQ